MQFPTFSILLLQIASYGLAAPAASCSSYSNALQCLASDTANTQGTPFCSSYLQVPLRTATTTTTIRAAPQTITNTRTATTTQAVATVTRTTTSRSVVFVKTTTIHTQSTVIVQSTVLVSSDTVLSCASTGGTLTAYTTTAASILARQGTTTPAPAGAPTPSCFSGTRAAAVSKICSCLAVAPSTTTQTVTRITTAVPNKTVFTTTTVTAAQKTTTAVTTITQAVKKTSITTVVDPATTVYDVTTATVVQSSPVFSGLAYYSYENEYDFNQPNPGQTVLQAKNPDYLATGAFQNLEELSFGYDEQCYLPGQPDYSNCAHLSLALQGFFYAPQAGDYNFYIDPNQVDNFLAFFSNETAYFAWDDDNADFQAIRDGDGMFLGGSVTFTLAEGELYPITMVYFNGGGPGSIRLQITPPDGNTYTDTTDSFVSPCAGSPFTP